MRIQCPVCQKGLLVDDSKIGAMAKCPGCGHKFQIGAAAKPTPIQAKQSAAAKRAAAAPPPDEDPGFDVVDEPEAAENPGTPAPHRVGKQTKEKPRKPERSQGDDADDEPPADPDEPAAGAEETPRPKKTKKKKKKEALGPSPRLLVGLGLGAGVFFLFAVTALLYVVFKPTPPAVIDPEQVIAIIRQHGGSVERDETSADKPVIAVNLSGCPGVKNNDIDQFKAFPKLETLRLGHTLASDVTMPYIAELRGLRILDLSNTKVTAAGIREIKTLTNLEELHLNSTLVTDNGLDELKGLTKLRLLTLDGTLASGLGLQAALPNLKVEK